MACVPAILSGGQHYSTVAFTGVQFSALGGTGSKGVSNDKGDAIRTRNSYGKKGNGDGYFGSEHYDTRIEH